jgi:hypothetical protein
MLSCSAILIRDFRFYEGDYKVLQMTGVAADSGGTGMFDCRLLGCSAAGETANAESLRARRAA